MFVLVIGSGAALLLCTLALVAEDNPKSLAGLLDRARPLGGGGDGGRARRAFDRAGTRIDSFLGRFFDDSAAAAAVHPDDRRAGTPDTQVEMM